MKPGDERDIGDLPAFVRDKGGEQQLQACAETYLSERAGEAILARGLMPFLSIRNQNAARLLRFQSLAETGAAVVRTLALNGFRARRDSGSTLRRNHGNHSGECVARICGRS